MAVKLHRCATTWVKIDAHPCWKVVQGPVRRSTRTELERFSGQRLYPLIELEDGRCSASNPQRWRLGSGP
jgi:hypothetical protein